MVRRVLQIVFREVRGLHQAAYVLAVFTFGSQLLALIRDRLLASTFGASQTLDLYYAAFKIPDLLFVLFASTLSVYVLIPFVARERDQESTESARVLLSQVFTAFLIAYILLALVIAYAIPYLVPYLFPGLVAESEMLVMLVRIMLLQPLFLGVSSLFGVVTQLSHRFVLYAISPLIYNIGIIVGIVFLYPIFGIAGLAYGVVAGAVGHMLVQIPFVRRSELRFGFNREVDAARLSDILTISLPRALTLSLNQITLLFLVGLASTMTVGSVAVFQFAYNLHSVPLAIIGVSYSVAAFPLLADLYAKGDLSTFRLHINSAIRHIIFWSMPAIALIVVIRAQIVRVVLGAGQFNWDDTRLTAAVLAILALSLVAQAINLLFIRALYAGGYTRAPLLIAGGGFVAAIALAYGTHALYVSHEGMRIGVETLFRVREVPGTEILMIALAFTISVIGQSIVLAYEIVRAYQITLVWVRERLYKAFAAALAGGVAAYATLNFVVFGIDDETLAGIILQGGIGGLVGIVAIGVTYYFVRMPEFFEVRDTFHKRIFKMNPPTGSGGTTGQV